MKYILPLPRWEKYEGYEMGMISGESMYKIINESKSCYIIKNDLGMNHAIPKKDEEEYYIVVELND